MNKPVSISKVQLQSTLLLLFDVNPLKLLPPKGESDINQII